MRIQNVSALEILDSRGNPTVKAFITTESGYKGYGIAPSGASTGSFEAVELRDMQMERFHGKGVRKAISNIEGPIRNALIGMDVREQDAIDKVLCLLDDTENKEKIGANATLPVSIACVRAASSALQIEPFAYIGGITADLLPLPMMNVINGGAHAKNNLDIQEFMLVPTGAEMFSDGLRMCTEVYHTLKKCLELKGYVTAVGDEGGFAPDFKCHTDAIEMLIYAIEKSGYKAGEDIKIALDAASTEWFFDGIYKMPKSGEEYTPEALSDYWEDLVRQYPIISIEDPATENDWETWKRICKRLKVQIVGDDLFVTNKNRLQTGIQEKAANAILIKPNQIGTISETIEAVKLAKSVGFGTIISHRSGDTEDNFIADLAVGLLAGQIKTGAPCRSERTAKYNRLLEIEQYFHKK